jgi:hypothetical protein
MPARLAVRSASQSERRLRNATVPIESLRFHAARLRGAMETSGPNKNRTMWAIPLHQDPK